MSGGEPDVDRFLACVARLQAEAPRLTAIQAGLLVAAHLGVAHDSRTFARKLGLAHALVLRELNVLAEQGALLHIQSRDARTMRTAFTPGTGAGRLLALLP
ncbi:hypothetical protein [Sinorhizobium sp. RAC02]|uniref:hypothetical protein n=1 Tax=Sinorhizobium sp. RAC02 TaxID=1842534 RepID=UPI00083DCCFB|nr:hypothetical protein [Sinorhizobium sp. RAC02]AOF93809.1 hypothetical protein BSY16_4861 [Sinorhizobium sp. RAC02]